MQFKFGKHLPADPCNSPDGVLGKYHLFVYKMNGVLHRNDPVRCAIQITQRPGTREGVPRGKRRRLAHWLAAPFLIVEGMLTNGKRNSPPSFLSPFSCVLPRSGGQPGLRWMADDANTQIRRTNLASWPHRQRQQMTRSTRPIWKRGSLQFNCPSRKGV